MANVLAVVLLLGGVLAALLGAAILKASRSAVHEIEALICFLTAVCGLGFAAVVQALDRTRRIEIELRALHKLAAEAGQRDVLRVAKDQQPMR